MAAWPETLPQSPLIDGFRETPANTALRTEMDTGPAKLRQRTTAATATLSLTFIISTVQLATLDSFYADTLQGGTLSFDFTHPVTGETVNCRFRQPPARAALAGGYFRTGIELEVLP
ncbi:MAG: hypothetical protein ACAH80_04740 [Alphaproteobacteria bacterium]